ncbi:MAG: site-specific integrase [Chthoniobacteraceae bacterium]
MSKRYSLEAATLNEALENLKLLDAAKAVELNRADRSILNKLSDKVLPLEDGKEKYLAYVGRPPVMGGAGAKTAQRYRAVFDKFNPFAREKGVDDWNRVSQRLLESYGAWLDDNDYAYATEYLELATLKQAMKWMIGEKLIPAACGFSLKLKKPSGTSTYCYTPAEVSAMIAHCIAQAELNWLGDAIVALAHTGLRISELAGLRWSDLDEALTKITLTDERRGASRENRASARGTKSGRDRTLPIHPRLHEVLVKMKVHLCKDGRVFHGPNGGILKPDTLRIILKRDVLTPLSKRFPKRGAKELIDGRLHSFRHYFCSTCANAGTPEHVLMNWLGHRDSQMVRHYFHMHEQQSRQHMDKINFLADTADATLAPVKSA